MSDWTELKRLAEESSSGEWEHINNHDIHIVANEEWELLELRCDQPNDAKDAAFIAAANPKTILALIAENERLEYSLSAPETITAEPHAEYESLRKQFMSLRMLANSNAKMVHHWRDQCGRETRETLLANAENVNAERDTNAMLTDALEAAEAERDQLRAEVEALRKVFAWTPSDHKYDPEIHHNPDAKAWADLFVSTFPGLAEKHDLMLGWFANAMMAMHDFLAQRDNNDLESMRKYAERYLYLRSCHWNDSPLVVVRNPKQQVKLGAYCPSGNLLDDAIDAEIARTSQ